MGPILDDVLDDTPGRGSMFWFDLPSAALEARAMPAAATAAA